MKCRYRYIFFSSCFAFLYAFRLYFFTFLIRFVFLLWFISLIRFSFLLCFISLIRFVFLLCLISLIRFVLCLISLIRFVFLLCFISLIHFSFLLCFITRNPLTVMQKHHKNDRNHCKYCDYSWGQKQATLIPNKFKAYNIPNI
jgi:hypothetical protein